MGTVSEASYNVISGATVATSGNNLLIKGVTTGTTTATLKTVTPTAKTGYSFGSWSKTSGSITAATTITATFTANELTFGNQTISKTYSTSEQTASITAATNGTGTYTYAIQSQKNTSGTTVNYFSLEGTTLTIAANTPVNGSNYAVVIRATDSGSGVTKDATYTITIGKQTVNPPSNLSVNTAGKVTWTASSNATGYEISIDNTTWTTFTSGSSYSSKITETTGNRTVSATWYHRH